MNIAKKNCLKNWKIRFWNHAERRITGQFPLTIYLSCHVVEEKRIFEFFLLCFYSFMQNHSCRLEYMHDSPDSPVSCKQNQITIFLLNCLFFLQSYFLKGCLTFQKLIIWNLFERMWIVIFYNFFFRFKLFKNLILNLYFYLYKNNKNIYFNCYTVFISAEIGLPHISIID